jgi:hypothetical protein
MTTSINLSPEVQNLIVSVASVNGVDPAVVQAIAAVNSNGNQFNPDGSLFVSPIGVGIMGVSYSVGATMSLDVTTLQGNVTAAVQYLAILLKTFVGNYSFAVAAYYSGPNVVFAANGIPNFAPAQEFVYNVSTLSQITGSNKLSLGTALRNQSNFDPDEAPSLTSILTTPGASQQAQGSDYFIGSLIGAYSPNAGTDLFNSLNQSIQVPDDTLRNQPWFNDTGLVTGNPAIRKRVQPVSFVIYLDQQMGQQLRVPDSTGAPSGAPIELQLNTSLTTFSINSRHVYNRQPSRTGQHITFWGMQPDLITGSGSTGVMMNQFGLTDFFSVANIGPDVAQLISSGFSHSFRQNAVNIQNGVNSTGEVFVGGVAGGNQTASQVINNLELNNPNEALRVAAQDCFVEFLKLFQMNGNRWYYTPNYSGSTTGQDQMAPNAFSPQTGITSFMQHQRNNDVMTRGYVAMKYRSTIYLGYFKTLNWSQDAESPFQWKFDFSFQVERTYSALYTVNSAAQPTNPNSFITLPNGTTIQSGIVQTTTSTLPDQVIE